MSRLIDIVRAISNQNTKVNFFKDYYILRLKTTTSEQEATAILNMSLLLNLDIGEEKPEQSPIDIPCNSHNSETKSNFMKEHYNSRLKTTTNKQEADAILNLSSLMNLHIEDDEIERKSDETH